MSLEEMRKSEKVFLSPSDVAGVLESDPHTIRCTAQQRPDLIGYPYTFTGNRMKIPRLRFLEWLGVLE